MIGVLGATGQVGMPLVRQLSDHGQPVRALAHTEQSSQKLQLPGVDVHNGDMHDPEAIERFLDGVEQLFLLSAPGPDQTELQNAIVDAAVKAGVDAIVKLSVYTAAKDALSAICRWHQANDDHIRTSGLKYTIIQPHTFMQTIGALFAGEIQASGRMTASVAPDLAMSIVHSRDVAELSAAILERGEHHDETLLVTGQVALSYLEIAQLISERLGRPIEYEQISADEVLARFLAVGLPDWMAGGIVDIQRMYATCDADPITDVIERWTGHPPRTFSDYLDDNPGLFG